MNAVLLLPQWMTDEHAITWATWALVVVTFLLVVATGVLWLDFWKKQRERWRRDDAQRVLDREEQQARWLREDSLQACAARQAMLSDLYADFSSPEMKRARTDFAYSQFAWNSMTRYHTHRRPSDLVDVAKRGASLPFRGEGRLLAFFTELGRKLECGEIAIADVDRKFGEYIFHFGESMASRNGAAIEPVLGLRELLGEFRSGANLLKANTSVPSRKDFWFYEIDADLISHNG